MVGIFLFVAVATSFAGDNRVFAGDGSSIVSQWLPILLFSAYALLQIACLALYRFGLSVYRIGFVLLHVGILVMLVGFLVGALGGKQSYFNLTTGTSYGGYYDSDNNYQNFGFTVEVSDFTVEKYESGSDKFYHADLLIRDSSTGTVKAPALEVNHTVRQSGWKIYLMSYSDGKTVGELANKTVDRTFRAVGWTELSGLISESYPDQSAPKLVCYNLQTGAYRETTDEALTVSATMPVYGHAVLENGKLTVYVYPEQLQLLFKQDPGEYAVLVGMVMIFAGVLMTCLFRCKKSGNCADSPSGKTEESAKRKRRIREEAES